MAGMGCDTVGMGQSDSLVSGDQFYDAAHKHHIDVLNANPYSSEKTLPFVVRNVGGVKVGIVSFGYVPPDQDPEEFLFRKALYSAYKQARDASDILVVLDQSGRVNRDWITRNGPRLGAPDVVIGGLGTGMRPQEEVVGTTHLVVPTTEGKQIGVVDVQIAADGARTITSRCILLGADVAEDTVIAQRVTALLHPEQVAVGRTSTAAITAEEQAALQTSSRNYYPPAACKACHVTQYEDWAGSKHAHAIKALSDAGRALPECMPCHSEEYLRTGKAATTAEGVGGVDCQSCHFESLPHGLERKSVAKPVKLSPVKCLSCHNKDRSPAYNEQAYFPRVAHKTAPAH